MDKDQQKYRITITAHGPYRVTGGVPLLQRYPAMSVYGEPLAWDPVGANEVDHPVQPEYELCRCGHSGNKPYCDGTHEQVNFDGSLTAPHEPSATRRETFTGDGLILTDDQLLCADAGFCGTRFTKVWQMIKRTTDPEIRARLITMVSHCPSGRLQVTLDGTSTPDEPRFTPSIAVIPDGPLWVRGGIEIQDSEGYIYEIRNRVTLCRCGQSKNQPFCDSTHADIGFKAPLDEG